MNRSYVPAVGACLIAMASAAMAQAPQQQAPARDPAQGAMPTQPQPAANVSDDQLRKFVSAAQKVAMISQEYTPRLNAATDAASQQQVHKEVDAVHREGLTVDEFNGIGQAVEQNPNLAQRARDMAK